MNEHVFLSTSSGQRTTDWSRIAAACSAVVAVCGLTVLASGSGSSHLSLYTTAANGVQAVHYTTAAANQGRLSLGSTKNANTFMHADIQPARNPQRPFPRAQEQKVGSGAEAPTDVFTSVNIAIVTAFGALGYFLGRPPQPQLAVAGAGTGGYHVDLSPTFLKMSTETDTATTGGGGGGGGGGTEPELPPTSDISTKTGGDVDGTFANKTASDLEVMYVDALWSFYKEGKAILTDDEFDRLRMELNWQGSGFPTLHRDEIRFVEAVLASYRGEPIMSDAEYDALKLDLNKIWRDKRSAVTSVLLTVKGKQELSPEAYERLCKEMDDAGTAPSPYGYACTLSDTPNTLRYEVADVLVMYSALGLVPSAVCSLSWGFLGFLFGGLGGIQTAATIGFPFIGASSFLLTRQMVRYLDLTGPVLVPGTCPCCQTEIKASFFDILPKQKTEKCANCGTVVGMDADEMLIKDAAGFAFIGDTSNKKKSVDEYLSWASGVASGALIGSNEESRLGGKKFAKKPKPGSKDEMIKEELKAGIFAWAVLLGYGIFGETFVGRVRGKGIALHSEQINNFCKRFNVPNGLRQKYIQTAKRNGHDLGFLVDGAGLIGDGMFGKEAMAWWKEQGF